MRLPLMKKVIAFFAIFFFGGGGGVIEGCLVTFLRLGFIALDCRNHVFIASAITATFFFFGYLV